MFGQRQVVTDIELYSLTICFMLPRDLGPQAHESRTIAPLSDVCVKDGRAGTHTPLHMHIILFAILALGPLSSQGQAPTRHALARFTPQPHGSSHCDRQPVGGDATHLRP